MDNLGYVSSQNEEGTQTENPFRIVAAANNNTLKQRNDCDIYDAEAETQENDEDSDDISGRCGMFGCKPDWLQRFPTKNWFIVVFLLATTIKGMAGSYFPSTISTIEKRLKISTETIGYFMSGNEISQIAFALVLAYFGGKGHRPRWIAFGIFSSSVAYFMYSSPHLIYGPGNQALSYTKEYYAQFRGNGSEWTNGTEFKISTKNFSDDLNTMALCNANRDLNASHHHRDFDCGVGDDSIVPLAILFVSQFIAGIGSVLVYSLAGPFIDDHMKPLQAPILIGVTGAVRQTGPLMGYVMAYFCLKVYISPLLTPLITNKDEGWLGAWWLGGIIFSVMMIFVAILMALFPRVLRTASTKSKKKQSKVVSLPMEQRNGTNNSARSKAAVQRRRSEPIHTQPSKDIQFWPSLVDLMRNKANLWNNLSILFFGFAFSGFGSYFPKYLETVIKQNAANAALTAGLSSIFFQVFGLCLGGYVIAKFSLRARTLASVNILVDIMIVFVLMSFSQLVCKQGQVVDTTTLLSLNTNTSHSTSWELIISNQNHTNGQDFAKNGSFQLSSTCSSGCQCTSNQNVPVCYQEKKIIFESACHAGCKNYDAVNQKYTNCSCLPSPDITLKVGKCIDPDDCFSKFVIFLILLALVRFAASFGRIGNVLIPYRCVDRSQKSMASGLSFVMWSIVSIPSPILYGKLIDSACIRWGSKCGERGNCLLYDDVSFAYVMSSTAAGLSLFGLICDVMVWYYVKDLKLYGEEEEKAKESDYGNGNGGVVAVVGGGSGEGGNRQNNK